MYDRYHDRDRDRYHDHDHDAYAYAYMTRKVSNVEAPESDTPTSAFVTSVDDMCERNE
jgi:hypothetical protein